jgi:hypothetical protein
MPEFTVLESLEALSRNMAAIKGKGHLAVDCSPRALGSVGISTLVNMGVSALRLDYGFSRADIEDMLRMRLPLSLVLNASMISTEHWIRTLPTDRVEFWHNFYPRPETGLTTDFVSASSRHLKGLGFRVGAFLPNLASPRIPLGYGLPTVERHRQLSPVLGAAELLTLDCLDIILLGDPCKDTKTIGRLRSMIEDDLMIFRMTTNTMLRVERECTFGATHVTRPDQGEHVIRSATSRQMAAMGQKIPSHHCVNRPRYSVTVDNEGYGRYSGELQITLQDLAPDPKVNVIGRIISDDWPLVALMRPGSKFRLIEV